MFGHVSDGVYQTGTDQPGSPGGIVERDGTGLDLAIVNDVVGIYGGRIAEESEDLGGLLARLSLPTG
jgi:signal transduction histidine kinase